MRDLLYVLTSTAARVLVTNAGQETVEYPLVKVPHPSAKNDIKILNMFNV